MAPKLIIPTDADQLREMLTDRTTMNRLLEDPKLFAEFTENTIQARLKSDPAILAQVKEQTEAFMVDWLRGDGKPGTSNFNDAMRRLNLDAPNARGRIPKNSVYNSGAAGAPFDGSFPSLGNFAHAVSTHAFRNETLAKKLDALQNAMSSVKPADGGFLLTEELRSELLRVALESAVVRPRARVIPMGAQTLEFPAIDSTSNVSSVHGGIIGYWTEEGATLTESKPKFGRVKLTAHKLTLYTEVPNELVRDAQSALDMFFSEIFPEAYAWFEDVAFAVGGGVGEPLGYLNAPCAVALSRTGSGASIDWPDVAGMYSRMLPQSLNRAVWVVSPDSVYNLLTMPFTVGGSVPILTGGGSYPSGADERPMTILNRPVVVSEKAKALGTSGDINFVDFGFYLVGDRQAMSMRQSEDYKFGNDETAYRITARLDGRPWLKSAITPQNGSSNTLSPFVKLGS